MNIFIYSFHGIVLVHYYITLMYYSYDTVGTKIGIRFSLPLSLFLSFRCSRGHNSCARMYEPVASTTAKVSTITGAYVWYGLYWESKAFQINQPSLGRG